MRFFNHMAALVGDFAGFPVPLCPEGLFPLPSLFLTLPASVTGARTPGVGAHG